MGQRRDRLNKRVAKQIATRRSNSRAKTTKRARRDRQMLALITKGQLPYTPGVMSWLSNKLGKKAANITTEDIRNLVA